MNSKEQSPDIKIFVVCHKPSEVAENPYLFPIQVGSALAGERLPNMLHDDEGENISAKNRSFCELTAQYWAWKNISADYYGFFHYRRYFSFDPEDRRDDGWGNIVFDRIDENMIKSTRLGADHMKRLITRNDVILVRGRHYPHVLSGGKPLDVYREYGEAPFQHREDLDKTLAVLKTRHPEFAEAADEYMHSTVCHECNMFIMKRELFQDYAAWLFDILFEVEKEIDTTDYSVEEFRIFGYLAERLCGIYSTWLKKRGDLNILELPKTLIRDTEPKKVLEPPYEKEVPVVLSANNKFAPYLDVMVRSIVANAAANRNYDIIILYNDISEQNQRWIAEAADSCQNISIRFMKVSQYFDSSKLFVNQHLSVETYYRLIIPEIMPHYHKILYLDCDMVADRDVAELYDLPIDDAVIGAVRDIDVAGQVRLKQNQWDEYIAKNLLLSCASDYFQAGVLIINLDRLREITTADKMIHLALSASWRCHDQDVLNMICKGKVCYLPQQWNVLMNWQENDGRSRMQIMKMAPRNLYSEYQEARKRPYLIHFAGYQKPWDTVDCDFTEYFWKYAKLSPFYQLIVFRIKRALMYEEAPDVAVIQKEAGLRKIANRFLPYGSRRREILKKWYYRLKG